MPKFFTASYLFTHPAFNATLAVSIDASPVLIWPWLVQIGYKRAGWYGYNFLDNGGIPS